MALIKKQDFLLFNLKDENEILVSVLENRPKYLTLSECELLMKKLQKSKEFAENNNIENLNT